MGTEPTTLTFESQGYELLLDPAGERGQFLRTSSCRIEEDPRTRYRGKGPETLEGNLERGNRSSGTGGRIDETGK